MAAAVAPKTWSEESESLDPDVSMAKEWQPAQKGRRGKTGGDRPAKRHRIGLACEECRERKVKCDGLRPACSTCLSRKEKPSACSYQAARIKGPIPYGYIEQLERRIHQLEEIRNLPNPIQFPEKRSSSVNTIPASIIHGVDQPKTAEANPAAFDPHLVSPLTSGLSQHSRSILDDLETTHGVDAMGAVYSSDVGIVGQGALNSSSSASFMNQVREAVESKARTSSNALLAAVSPSFPIQEPERPEKRHFNPQQFVLPLRRVADHLMNLYWTQIHILYPFIDKVAFKSQYEALWTGQDQEFTQEESMLFCVLNMMFALSALLSQDSSIYLRETAPVYYERASSLLQIGTFEHVSRRMIQALLLMARYLQSTDGPDGCWTVVGMAIRIAQGQGIHMNDLNRVLERQNEREMARRIWHSCVMMDRTVSMCFGRPLMISESLSHSVPSPAAIDDEYLSSTVGIVGSQPEGKPSLMEFFVHDIQLSSILGEILRTFYTPPGSSDASTPRERGSRRKTPELDFNSVVRLDEAMTSWQQSLPEHLVWHHGLMNSLSSLAFIRQANVLRLRFLHLQILLFRPVLAYLLRVPPHTQNRSSARSIPLQHSLAVPCADRCVSAAQQTIQLFEECETFNRSTELLPSWWYRIFYIYTAATVLIAGRIYRPADENMNDDSLKASWAQSLHMLRHLSINHKSGRRCLAALEFLDRNQLEASTAQENIPPNSTTTTTGGTKAVQLANQCVPPSPPPSQDVIKMPGETIPAGGGDVSAGVGAGDFSDLIELQDYGWQDFGWLESVPSDLLQFDGDSLVQRRWDDQ